MNRRLITLISFTLFFLYFSFLFLCPLLFLVYEFFTEQATSALLEWGTLSIVFYTLKQSLFSTFLSVGMGISLGLFLFKHSSKKAIKIYEWLLLIPFLLPSLLVAMSFIAAFGEHSVLKSIFVYLGYNEPLLYSFSSIVIAHTFINAPWIALQILHAQKTIPHIEKEAIKTLTYSHFTAFKIVYWPRLKWTLYSSAIQVFQLCSFSFIIVLLLGGGPPNQTIETALYSSLRSSGFETSPLLPLSFYGVLLCFIPWAFVLFFESKKSNQIPGKIIFSENKNDLQPPPRLCLRYSGVFLVTVFLLPYIYLFSPLFSSISLSLLFNLLWSSETLTAIFVSLKIALTQTSLTLIICLCLITLYKNSSQKTKPFLFLLAQLPSGFSALIIGFNLLLFYGVYFNFFEKNFWPIIFLQSILFFPFAFRLLWPSLQLDQAHLYQSAQTLGATPRQAFLAVEWPRWKKPLFITSATLLCFSLGDISSVLLFYSDDFIPLTVLISRRMGQYRFEEAQALSTLLVFIILIVLSLFLGLELLNKLFYKITHRNIS